MSKIALITGATSGIGEATARIFAEHGIDLILCGRRAGRIDALKKQLDTKVKVETLVFDVRDKDTVFQLLDNLPEKWKKIDILVNNAGNAHGLDPIHEGKLEDWEAMIDINVKGLLYVSKGIIPGMVERKSGHIINIGSIAGKEIYPNGNVYCASKFAVDAINNGMRLDLNKYGIKVSQVNPGLVNTEFSLVRFKGDRDKADSVYKGMKPLTGNDVAELILFIVTRPPHVNISDSIIFPTAQASATIIKRD
jgi:3-hydroxy acid dehydrogenase/malonic semialdehyde reductase